MLPNGCPFCTVRCGTKHCPYEEKKVEQLEALNIKSLFIRQKPLGKVNIDILSGNLLKTDETLDYDDIKLLCEFINPKTKLVQSQLKNAKRQLERHQKMLKDLKAKGEKLSKHGYEQVGYLKGMIRKQEDIIDILEEVLK